MERELEVNQEKRWYKLGAMVGIYIAYLGVGAAIFQYFESPYEVCNKPYVLYRMFYNVCLIKNQHNYQGISKPRYMAYFHKKHFTLWLDENINGHDMIW